MTRRDEAARERRARFRALQAPAPEPYDWAELARIVGLALLLSVAFVAVVVVYAGLGGAALDWLERVLP